MSKHHVTVHQLATGGGAFLNGIDAPGRVGVWGFATASLEVAPVYLMRNGPHFQLVAFDDERWAKEWLADEGNQKTWPLVIRLSESTP